MCICNTDISIAVITYTIATVSCAIHLQHLLQTSENRNINEVVIGVSKRHTNQAHDSKTSCNCCFNMSAKRPWKRQFPGHSDSTWRSTRDPLRAESRPTPSAGHAEESATQLNTVPYTITHVNTFNTRLVSNFPPISCSWKKATRNPSAAR